MNPKRPIDFVDDDDMFDELFSVASYTECTGLSPFAPHKEVEEESYKDIYDIPFASDEKYDDTENPYNDIPKNK